MKKQTVFVASTLSGFMRIFCVTALLFTLSACGSNSSGDSGSGSDGSSVASEIKLLAVDDGVNGIEPWKTDGTADGTLLVKDINTTSDSYPSRFFVLNSTLYFYADEGAIGTELWKTDGTAGGTVMVKDFTS